MASIQGILSPNIDNSLQELDREALQRQPVPEIGWKDYAVSAFKESYIGNTGYSLAGMAVGHGSPEYNVNQLQMLYPDVPPEYWKGSANSFQAELLYDRYNQEKEKKQLYDLVTDISDPNKGLAADTIGAVAGLGAGLSDPINLAAGYLGGVGAKLANIPVSKIAPNFMKIVASSRLGGSVAKEIAENFVSDVGITYSLQKGALNEYDQQERGLVDTMQNSIGTSIAFGALRHFGAKAKGAIKSSGSEFIDKMKEQNFFKTKDKVNSALNSDSANKVAFEDAAAHTATAPNDFDHQSSTERLSARAFATDKTPTFGKANFYGVFEEASGKSDYAGERFGDHHAFVSSPEAAQGMFDMYAKDGAVYSIYGHKGDLKLLDLENSKAIDFPEVLDSVEKEMGKGIWKKLDDSSTLADVFRAVNDSAEKTGASGSDIVAMHKEIARHLSGEGYEGTLHNEQLGETRHQVMSVFDEAMKAEHLEQLHKGESSEPTSPKPNEDINLRTDKPVTTVDGETIDVSEPVPYDTYYDEDPDFKKEYAKYNDPEYLKRVQETNAVDLSDVKIEDNIKEVASDLKESIRQMTDKEIASDKATDVNVKNVENYVKLEDEVKLIQEELKKNPPEKEGEFAKAVENCLRKG